jgi:hypothetical protein
MSKKKKPEEKDVLYIEMPASIKARLARLAEVHFRKMTQEAIVAILRYVKEEEEKEGLPPLE